MRQLLIAALVLSAAIPLSGCVAAAVGGAAIGVAGAAVGVTAKTVGVAARGTGAVVGAVIPGGHKDKGDSGR